MRTRWERAELANHTLGWLVDIVYAGRTIRVSPDALGVSSDGGVLRYDATLEAIVWARAIPLFSRSAEPESIGIEGHLPVDVPTLRAQGHILEGAYVQVSQVRLDRNGAIVDTHEDRRVCLTGRVRDAEYGAYKHHDGEDAYFCFVRFTAERGVYAGTLTVPSATEVVNRSTWPVQGRLGSMDVGVAYPVPIGYPGKDPLDWRGCMPAYRAVWASKMTDYHTFIVGSAAVDASTIRIMHDDNVPGITGVIVGTELNRGTALADEDAVDLRGQLLAVVDYSINGYDSGGVSDLGGEFQPAVDEEGGVWIGFDGGGGILHGGGVLRDAGDVIEYLLQRSGLAVDYGTIAAAKPLLAWCKVDTAIDAACLPLDWLTDKLFPLLPVSLYGTESGLAVWVWNPDASRSDAVCHIDADADRAIQVGERVTEDASNCRNRFALTYGLNARSGTYEYAARLGPDYIAPTVQAEGVIWQFNPGTNETTRLFCYARTPGVLSVPITVTIVIGGGAPGAPGGVVDDATAGTVTITMADMTYTLEQVATAINDPVDGSALIEAVSAGSGVWSTLATLSPSTTLRLHDWGTAASPRCAQSREVFAAGDTVSAEAGIREEALTTDILYDHGTPPHVLDWMAAAYALPQRRVDLVAGETDYGWIEPGATALFTDTELGFSEALGIAEAVENYGDGTVGIRLVFIEGSARLGAEI